MHSLPISINLVLHIIDGIWPLLHSLNSMGGFNLTGLISATFENGTMHSSPPSTTRLSWGLLSLLTLMGQLVPLECHSRSSANWLLIRHPPSRRLIGYAYCGCSWCCRVCCLGPSPW